MQMGIINMIAYSEKQYWSITQGAWAWSSWMQCLPFSYWEYLWYAGIVSDLHLHPIYIDKYLIVTIIPHLFSSPRDNISNSKACRRQSRCRCGEAVPVSPVSYKPICFWRTSKHYIFHLDCRIQTILMKTLWATISSPSSSAWVSWAHSWPPNSRSSSLHRIFGLTIFILLSWGPLH